MCMPPEKGLARSPQALGYWVTVLENAILTRLSQMLSPFDISPLQFMILNVCLRGEANTVSSISCIVPFGASAISRQAETLRSRGLLLASRQESDRRVVCFDLTEEGRRLSADLTQMAIEQDRRMQRHLEAGERQILFNLTRKLAVALNEDG